MELLFSILGMILVGGFIGGLTNSLAIRMLFRPHEAKYIGKWKLPFTPGVIPRRRGQLARELGQLVVKYLLTVESIQLKLQEPALKRTVTAKFENELDNLSADSLTVRQFAHQYGIKLDGANIKNKLSEKIAENIWKLVEEEKDTPLAFWLEEFVSEKEMVRVAEFIREKGIMILNKEETKEKLTFIIQQYLQSKGFIANMVLSMFSTSELAAKIQRLATSYLRSEDGYHWLHQQIKNEWEEIKQLKVNDIMYILEKKDLRGRLQNLMEDRIDIDQWLDKPVGSLLSPFFPQIKKRILPAIVEKSFVKLSNSIPAILKQLEVEKMVENTVASFPTSRIEELVLSIISKEFKLIVYLGVLLGGIIGLIQAAIFILV